MYWTSSSWGQSFLTISVFVATVTGKAPIPTGCSIYDGILNGNRTSVSIIGKRTGNIRSIRGLYDTLGLVKTSVLKTISASIPLTEEHTSTCRISSNTSYTFDFVFLRAMKSQSSLRTCYICDGLQPGKGQCSHMGFCPQSSVCYTGFNRDSYAMYEQNSTLNSFIYPAAVAHGCCDPVQDHLCRNDVKVLHNTANYTIQTCSGFLCNADDPSQNLYINAMLEQTTTTTTTTATTIGTTTKPPVTWLSWGPWECQVTHGVCLETRTRNCSLDSHGLCSSGSNYNVRPCTACPDATTAGTTTEAPATWMAWAPWTCQSVKGSCLEVRNRNCSRAIVNADGTVDGVNLCGTNYYNIQPCSGTTCPDYFTTAAPTTNPPCNDDPTANCDNPELLSLLCDSPSTAKMCQRSCGQCPDQVSACNDDPTASCDNPELLNLLCGSPVTAKLCQRSCGQCPDQVCTDSVNCTASLKSLVCGDDTLARTYCRKSCHKCAKTALFQPPNYCDRCHLMNGEICICGDPELRPLCSSYCDGSCSEKPTGC